ncbi:MAG: hypothetical protein IJD79_05845 [Clostridia bacterium]|nr:hypothetical protein [Clostridia bacterium]
MNKKRLIRLIALVLAVITAFTLCIPVFGLEWNYDYTYRGSDKSEYFSPADILEEQLSESVSTAERSFLESYSTLALKYNSVINANKVTLEHESGVLTVRAKEYSYSAENGKTFVWIPDYVTVKGESKNFEKTEEEYVALLESDTAEDAEVYYKAETEISKSDLDVILNLYYHTAKYASDMSDYTEKHAAYEKYVYEKRVYDDALAEYNRYLDDYAEYEETKYIYEHYDELLIKYEQDKIKYNEYLESLRTHEEDIKKYEKYEEELALVRKQLSAFELVYVDMKMDRNIYDAVTGGTVDQVLVNEGAILSELGSQYKNIVAVADRSTKDLRRLMEAYLLCETEEEKYNFYITNYKKICESMFGLTWSLDELYYAPGIIPVMKSAGKHEKYVILVAQLVLTSCALIDGEVRHENTLYGDTWKIDKRTYTEVLENKTYFVDDDTSKPLEKGYPVPVPKPDIEEVENPVLPEKPSSKPIPPKKVDHPGDAPEEISPAVLPEAKIAAAESLYDKLSADEKAKLCEGIKNNEIRIRSAIDTPKTINLQTKVFKKLGSETVTLDFKYRNASGEIQTYSLITDKDTPVAYDGPIPDTYTDETGTFAFDGWLLEATNESAELSLGYSENTVFVPKYKNVTTYFDVTWKVGNESIVETHPSNLIPEPQFVPSIPDDGDFYFEFAGWDKELEAVTEDITYTAVFNKKYIVPIGESGAAITTDNGVLTCDASEFENDMIDVSLLMPRLDGRYALKLITEIGELEFSFTDVGKMALLGVDRIEMLYQSNGISQSESVFNLYSNDGAIITDSNVFANVKIYHDLETLSDTVLKCGEDYVKFSSDVDYIFYRAEACNPYMLIKEFSVVVIKNELAEIKADRTIAYADDAVRFEIIKKPGVEIISVSVTDKNGNPLEFDKENNAVIVTDSDIVISLTAKYTVYDVVFVSNGVVVSHQELTYGTMPKLPSTPTMLSDEEYSYTFKGWSPEVKEVTEDALYEAYFEKTPLHANENERPSRDNFFSRVFKTVFIAVYNVMKSIRSFFDELFS